MFKEKANRIAVVVSLILFFFAVIGEAAGKTTLTKEKIGILKDEIFSKKHYSLQDFYQLGVLSFYEEAQSRGDAFIELIKKMRDSTARFCATKFRIKAGGAVSVGQATAVFLPNGYVLTAGHCLKRIEEDKDTDIQIVTVDGNTFKAKVVDSSYSRSMRSGADDWAILKLSRFYTGPTASIGTYKKFDDVVIMGYPRGISHDENHKVFLQFSEKRTYAIPFMGKIIGKDKITLTVGSDIIGGCSGGPVFNLKGEVIGILSATTVSGPDPLVRFCSVEKILKKHPELAEAEDSIY